MNRPIATKKVMQNDAMTFEEKEDELARSKELLEKVKDNPEERAKIKVVIRDQYNTVFFISPSKADNPEYIHHLIQRVRNQY